MGDTMLKHGMLGKNTFLNPRQDGVQEFIVTKALVEEYKEITAKCFAGVTEEESRDRVYGLFGDEDPWCTRATCSRSTTATPSAFTASIA